LILNKSKKIVKGVIGGKTDKKERKKRKEF